MSPRRYPTGRGVVARAHLVTHSRTVDCDYGPSKFTRLQHPYRWRLASHCPTGETCITTCRSGQLSVAAAAAARPKLMQNM